MRVFPEDPDLGWIPWAWLSYLAFFVANPMTRSAPAWEWPLTAAAVVAFLALYVRGWWTHGRGVVPIMVGLCVLGAALYPINGGATVFLIYAAGFAGQIGHRGKAAAAVALVMAVGAAESWLLGVGLPGWITSVLVVGVVGGVNIHFVHRHQERASLRLAHREVDTLARASERERIARDLHDLLGHTLSVVALKAELADKLAGVDPKRARTEMQEVAQLSRETLRSVRQAVRGYRDRELDAELANARLALTAANIQPSLEVQPVSLAPEAQSALALALREAVTNVIRHSRARRCLLRLSRERRLARLDVEDDGAGATGPAGAGIAGMRERVEAVGGHVAFATVPGTRVSIFVPMAPSGQGAAMRAAGASSAATGAGEAA